MMDSLIAGDPLDAEMEVLRCSIERPLWDRKSSLTRGRAMYVVNDAISL